MEYSSTRQVTVSTATSSVISSLISSKYQSADEFAGILRQITGWPAQVVPGGVQVFATDSKGNKCLLDIGEPAPGEKPIIQSDLLSQLPPNMPPDVVSKLESGIGAQLRDDLPPVPAPADGEKLWQVTVKSSTAEGGDVLKQLIQALGNAGAGKPMNQDMSNVSKPTMVTHGPTTVLSVAGRLSTGTPAISLLVNWYGLARNNVSLPELLASHASLAGAVPSQYRTSGVSGSFSAGGAAAMSQLAETCDDPEMMFECSGMPFFSGSLSTSRGESLAGGAWTLHLDGVSQLMAAPQLRNSLLTMFVGIAEASRAVFASVDVVSRSHPAGPWRGFLGLPSSPPWLAWFGPDYMPYLTYGLSQAPAGWSRSNTGTGVLMQLANDPTPAEGLQSWMDRRKKTPWMPSDLIAWGDMPAKVRPGV